MGRMGETWGGRDRLGEDGRDMEVKGGVCKVWQIPK